MSPTWSELVSDIRTTLSSAGIESAAREARAIAAHAMDVAPDRLTLRLRDVADQAEQTKAYELAARRTRREPLSHLLGRRMFFEHEFCVSPAVLDPRPETEALVRAALERPFRHVLDLGTGSGCILLSLLAARPEASGIGVDISRSALDVAADNAEHLGLEERAMFLQSNWLASVEGRFDLIVSNPPYISLDEMMTLDPELGFEPRIALTDEADGLAAYRILAPESLAHLRPGGRLLLEIGWQQGAAVTEMLRLAGYARVTVRSDLEGRDRVVEGFSPI